MVCDTVYFEVSQLWLAWVDIHDKVWGEIINLFLNFNSAAVEFGNEQVITSHT